LVTNLGREARASVHTLVEKARKAVERREFIDPDRITLSRKDVSAALRAAMEDMYKQGRASVLAEARAQGVEVADVKLDDEHIWDEGPRAIGAWMTAKADALSSAFMSRLKSTFGLMVSRQVSDSRFRATEMEDALNSSFETDIKRNAGSVILDSMAMGRHTMAVELNAGKALYSALNDKGTCTYCNRADGQVFDVGTQDYDDHMPPLQTCEGGDNCRCMYIYDFSGTLTKEDEAA